MMNKALWILPLLTLASCVSSQELEECQQNVKTLQQSQQVLQKELNDMRAFSQEQQDRTLNDQQTIAKLTTMIENQRQKIMSLNPHKKPRNKKRK